MEVIEHPGQRGGRRVRGVVGDELGRQHRVGHRVHPRPAGEVHRAVDEGLAEQPLQAGEAGVGHQRVAAHAQAEHGAAGAGPGHHRRLFIGAQVQAGALRGQRPHRQRRLRQHGREHVGLDHQRQREVPGDAHAEHADAGPAAPRPGVPAQRPQPVEHRAAVAGAEQEDLA
ncbi:MAG: hypothetical protein ACK56I_05105, partial [bacterium]